jgi:hypothetical protein
MNPHYIREKVLAALAIARNSRSEAQDILLRWADEDPRFLAELTQPFLDNITTYALTCITEGRPFGAPPKAAPKHPARPLPPGALDQIVEEIRHDMEKPPVAAAPPPPPVTKTQAAAILALAKGFQKGKDPRG